MHEVVPAEPVFYRSSVESMIRAAGREHLPVIEALGYERAPREAWPARTVTLWQRALARAAWPELTEDAGLYRLGRGALEQFSHTLVGVGVLTMARLLGTRRSLPKMGTFFLSATNFADVSVREAAADRFVLTFASVAGVPWYFKGVLDAASSRAGAVRLAEEAFVSDGQTLHVFWDLRPSRVPPFPGATPTQWL